MSRPTLRDVAARTGLSVTQVSRALNDHDDVAEATKQLARQAAAELRYTPNLEARRLRDPGARSHAIGIVLPSESLRFNDPFFGDMLAAMVATAADSGFQLSLTTHPHEASPTEPYDLMIRRKQVDGFVLLRSTLNDPRVTFLCESSTPFVVLGRPPGACGFPAVEIDHECFVPVVEHLVDLGHRRVACLAEPSQFALGAARLHSFRHAAATVGLAFDPELVVEAGFHEGSGATAAQLLLERDDPPTAIVAMNDLLALGALDAATRLGVDVPGQLSIVGFDDIPAARQVAPSLTTVRQSAALVGSALVELLLPRIERRDLIHAEHRITTSLVIRESTSPAAD